MAKARKKKAETGPTSRAKRPARPHSAAATYSSPACFLYEFAADQETHGTPDVQIKRVYDEPSRSDGLRVLVDRLWPRGIKKEDAALDAWLRDLAPSTELRKWFGHDPAHWPEFRKRYRAELREHAADLEALRHRATHKRVTLVYSARDPKLNQAVVLEEMIREVDG